VLQTLLWIIVASGLLLAAGAAYQIIGARFDRKRFPAPGRLIQVGRHKLHLFELGSGTPTVILESGISASHLNWRTVQTRLAAFAKVCSYDRAGLGWSELCSESCTPSYLAAQLYKMLSAASVPAPYILVGHSFGGLIVRSFATQYPQQTAGVVLVDPLDSAEWTPLSDEQARIIAHGIALSRRGAWAARLGVVRMCLSLLMAGNRLLPRMAAKAWSGRASLVTDRIAGQIQKMPKETWPLVAAHWKQPKCFEGMARHFECLAASIAEMRDAPPVQVPVTLLVGTQNEHPADPAQHARQISANTKLVHAQNSGHWIQLDEPELVIQAVREMIAGR
jgi:pimeloyl-ACP methyl ester carboxylesterase